MGIVTNVELAQKFRDWEEAIQERVVERNRPIKGLIVAALARAHHLQIGPPGVAKTYLVSTAMGLVEGVRYMDVLLHGHCLMEDLYGPISFKALDDDRWIRMVEDYLPTCDFFFGDEVFRGSPTLLNTNLKAFNEREFRNDGRTGTIPLISALFAANELPDDPVLQAFDDRIHMRYEVKPITDPSARIAMFQSRLLRASEGPLKPVLSIDDIREAHKRVDEVTVPLSVLEALSDLQDSLAAVNIHPTDRKVGESLVVMQATAFLHGRSTVAVEDMSLLQDMFWHRPQERAEVARLVADVSSPIDREVRQLAEDIEKAASEVEDIIKLPSAIIRLRRGVLTYNKLNAANDELRGYRARAVAENMQSDLIDETRRRLNLLTERLLRKGFKVPENIDVHDKEALHKYLKGLKNDVD